MLWIAHRGASWDAPENTLASFRLAWKQGADGIEGDFRLTRDRIAVCHHDRNTERTSGIKRSVARTSLASLRRLDVGSWKGPSFKTERIPTLEEVLASIRKEGWFFMEIKSGPKTVRTMMERISDLRSPLDRILGISFSAKVAFELKRQSGSSFRTGLLVSPGRPPFLGDSLPAPDRILSALDRTKADAVNIRNHPLLDDSWIRKIHDTGREVHVWVVDDPAEARRLEGIGVDSITTNRPGWMKSHVREPLP